MRVLGHTICRDLPIVSGPYELMAGSYGSGTFYCEIPIGFFNPGYAHMTIHRSCNMCGCSQTLWTPRQGFVGRVKAYLSTSFLAITTTTLLLRELNRKEAVH